MTHVGAWEIGNDDVPRRMDDDRKFLERNLETWIQHDPSLLGNDIRWVSRQLGLPDGSILDLLGLTRDNEWVIAELKAGSVGGNAVEQALHYFIQIAGMTNAQLVQRIRAKGKSDASVAVALNELAPDGEDSDRDYRLLVAGVGSGESAEAVAAILARHGLDIPIRVVTFRLLRDSGGRRILLREVDDDAIQAQSAPGQQWSLDHVLDLAQQFGVREAFEQIRSELRARGYREYLKKRGLNFNRRSRLQCFWVRPTEGRIHIGYLSGNFPSLFGVTDEKAQADMGANWLDLPPADAVEKMREWADIVDAYLAESTGTSDTEGETSATVMELGWVERPEASFSR